MIRTPVISCVLLVACTPAPDAELLHEGPVYSGVVTQILDDDLARLVARMENIERPDQLTTYAECAAARYALLQGFGFARHLRTNVAEKGGVWTADAVYTLSPTLPAGLRTIDAEVTVAACNENGIPTV